jgi:type VI secretion system secreted protein VgrG
MLNVVPPDLKRLLEAFSQNARLLQLTTPLGPNSLLLECMQCEESIDDGFRLRVSALSTNASIPLRSLIGQPALVELLTAKSRDDLRPFHGHITQVEMSGANGGLARYQLTVEPWSVFLAQGRDSRVFQNMTVFDILDTLFSAWRGKGKLVPKWRFDIARRDMYPVRSLTTQYQESDFTFARRLLNEEGLFYYFEHEADSSSPALGTHLMVIADHNGSFKPNRQPYIAFTQSSAVMKQDGLDRWRTEVRRQADSVEICSWDYRTLKSQPTNAASEDHTSDGNLTVREALGQYAYETSKQGKRMADNLVQGLIVRREVHIAAGTVRTLAPGTTFTVNGHAQHDAAKNDDERSFIVTRAVHLTHNNLSADLKTEIARCLPVGALSELITAEESNSLHAIGTRMGERPLYRVRIDAVRITVPYRPSRLDIHGTLLFPRPIVHGQQSAIVVGPADSVIHTDRDHRIKVQFHWQRGMQSHSRLEHPAPDGHAGAPADDSTGTWVRVATSMAPVAGANWGSVALPRVGQEVLVDFLDGDIDRPVIIGSLYNGKGGKDAQHNDIAMGAGAATGNAPMWFPGESAGHAHPASFSGYKSQAMAASQSGAGAYNQMVFDDSPGRPRVALQRHAIAHRGTDELNLGQLRHQTDNQRLSPAGFAAELKTEHSTAVRAGRGLLFSADIRTDGTGSQLDAHEAQEQNESSVQLQMKMATTAQLHNAALKDKSGRKESAPEKLPALDQMRSSIDAISGMASGHNGDGGGAGQANAFSTPQLQMSGPGGIAAMAPTNVVFCAGRTTSITAGQDINFAAQGNSLHAVAAGLSMFTFGKATISDKPNQEVGIRLHSASGKVSCQSQADEISITADKAIAVVSVTKNVSVASKEHIVLTAQGASIKLEGGNIMIHGPGQISFKASMKKLGGPKSINSALKMPKGSFKGCAQAMRDASAKHAGVQNL